MVEISGGGNLLKAKSNNAFEELKKLFTRKNNAFICGKTDFKTGFTLAEVLITLGIIGVVVAITIPNLIANHQKKVTSAKLKKAVSTINQAIKLSENENGEMETWDGTLTQEQIIDKYFRPYMKVMHLCKDVEKDCGYKGRGLWKYLNGSTGAYSAPNHGGRIPFIAMDGIVYTFSKFNNPSVVSHDNNNVIILDLNAGNNPNTFGKDIFFLYRVEEEDSIIPYGADKGTEEIRKSCSKSGNGLYCAAWIRENGWEIPSDYPWN